MFCDLEGLVRVKDMPCNIVQVREEVGGQTVYINS